MATGLSQSLSNMGIGSPPGLAAAGAVATVWTNLLREWVEDEVLQHFELVQASLHSPGAVSDVLIEYPDC